MGALDYLKDPSDPRVIEGLQNTCGICDRSPKRHCVDPQSGESLDRVVHLERTQQALDKRKKRADG